MNTFYTAYTRPIHGTIFYFVKKFIIFPELKDVPDIMESYGMHTDFNRACRIAQVKDPAIKQKLLMEMQTAGAPRAKVIRMNTNGATGYSMTKG